MRRRRERRVGKQAGAAPRLESERARGTVPCMSALVEVAPIVGVLENVRSLWNVGSMFRSADGAGL